MKLLALFLALTPLQESPRQPQDPTVERHVGLMGTGLGVRVWAAERGEALRVSELCVRTLEEAERRLSTWSAGDEPASGELARALATPPGEWCTISAVLARELADAFAISAETDGAFDPAVASLVKAWDLRGSGRLARPDELERALARSGRRLVELESTEDGGVARLRRLVDGVGIEEGGFGKGAGLRAVLAAVAATDVERVELDLGGQIAVYRRSQEGPAQRFAIAHPRNREQALVSIELAGGSVSTSGNSERGLSVGEVTIGHLLDPRTGRPAADFGSVTVWSSDPLRADALSTALFVLGPEEGLRWAEEHDDVEAVFIDVTAQGPPLVHVTSGLAEGLAALVQAVRIEGPAARKDQPNNEERNES